MNKIRADDDAKTNVPSWDHELQDYFASDFHAWEI